MIAVAELMNVEAEAGANVAEFGKLCGFRAGEVVVGGELHVGGFSLEGDDLEPGPFGQRGIVGEIVPARRCGAPVRIQYGFEGERLRRLHEAQLRAVDRAGHDARGIDGLDRVGDRDGRNGCAVLSAQPSIARAINALRGKRPGRVVDQHHVGLGRGQRLQAGADRGLPRRAARYRRTASRDLGWRRQTAPASSGWITG